MHIGTYKSTVDYARRTFSTISTSIPLSSENFQSTVPSLANLLPGMCVSKKEMQDCMEVKDAYPMS